MEAVEGHGEGVRVNGLSRMGVDMPDMASSSKVVGMGDGESATMRLNCCQPREDATTAVVA